MEDDGSTWLGTMWDISLVTSSPPASEESRVELFQFGLGRDGGLER
jgi:hypothetical protein